jgi:hypothetical protein
MLSVTWLPLKLFLTYIVPGSVLFPIIIFLVRRYSVPRPLRTLFIYLVVAAVVNFTAVILASLHKHNLWLLHPYTIIETVLLLFFFIQIFHDPKAKLVAWILLFAFPVVCVFNLLFLQTSSNFNTYTRSVEALLIIIASAYYWLSSGKETLHIPWPDNPLNWIISGLLLYFSSALFLFLFSNYLLAYKQVEANSPVWDIVWVIHGFLLMIMYLLFGIGFLKSKR